MWLGERGPQLAVPIAWAILDSDEGVWLVDCGMAADAAGDPAAFYGAAGRRARLDPSETLDQCLGEAGVYRDSIAGVLVTHLHYDHGGALVDLPAGLPVWVHEDELAAARAAGARRGYHPSMQAVPVRWHAFRGDQTPIEGVRLIETPGHSSGHVSALVELGPSRYLLTGDAAPTLRNLRERIPPGLQVDGPAAAASLDRLIALCAAGAIPLPSHDPDFWTAKDEPVVRFVAAS